MADNWREPEQGDESGAWQTRHPAGQTEPLNRRAAENGGESLLRWQSGQKPDESDDESYDPIELSPGGSGKQGDQQQFGQQRESRRDKSRNQPGSDKEHLP